MRVENGGRWIPLPFPECVECSRSWDQCVHIGCRGPIEVNPMSGKVKCLRCHESWKVWESSFLCPCGARFEASQIEDGLSEMLNYCRQLVYELNLSMQAHKDRQKMGEQSLRHFMGGLMESLGKAAGLVVESVLRFFISG